METASQPFVYSIVCRLFDKRNTDRLFPYVVSERDILIEVRKEVAAILAQMVADGSLTQTCNINGVKLYAPTNERLAESVPKI